MKKKVLIVDDSILMLKVIGDIISSSDAFDVVGTAASGEEALNKFIKLKPDVVTLDFEMPGEDGLLILDKMLNRRRVPVLMVSAHTKEGAEITLHALERGAADFMTKPSGTVSIDLYDLRDTLIEKLLVISEINLKQFKTRRVVPAPARLRRGRGSCIAIAASTGGVRALHEIMPALPIGAGLKGAIVIHMPPGFTSSLAERLNNLCQVVIREAKRGELMLEDQFLIAPGGEHSIVARDNGKYHIDFADAPPQLGLKPCADFLLASVAQAYQTKAIGIVLTGMGRDGARGIEDIKANGGVTIAEDPKTAIVPGMPNAAIKTGRVDHVVRLEEIPALIVRLNAT